MVSVWECVWLVGVIKVKRSRYGWLGFREAASAAPESCTATHSVLVWYDIHDGTGMSQSAFACLHFSVCMYMCEYVCSVCTFQLKVQ